MVFLDDTRLYVSKPLPEMKMKPEDVEIIKGWMRTHGVPIDVVAVPSIIYRNPEQCTVTYTRYVYDEENGRYVTRGCSPLCTCVLQESVVIQGETPPLPWPVELDGYRRPDETRVESGPKEDDHDRPTDRSAVPEPDVGPTGSPSRRRRITRDDLDRARDHRGRDLHLHDGDRTLARPSVTLDGLDQ